MFDKHAKKILELIKKRLFCATIFTKKECFNLSEEEYQKDWVQYYNLDCNNYLYGLSEKDKYIFLNALRIASANEETTFPDFVFPNGFIEHFQVTSSKTTRKGSRQAQAEAPIHNQVQEEIQRLNNRPPEEIVPFEVTSKSWKMKNYPHHSYENLEFSFYKNWNHHIESAQKYIGNKEIGIFIIENNDLVLNMIEDLSPVKGNTRYGNLYIPKSFPYYSLVHDKKMLDFMYSFREQVNYVIYITDKELEVIKLDSIPTIKKLQPFDYQILSSTIVSSTHTLFHVTLPNTEKEKRKDD